jgi:hypothetical protein
MIKRSVLSHQKKILVLKKAAGTIMPGCETFKYNP